MHTWETPFVAAAQARSVPEILSILEGQVTGHAQTPTSAVKQKAVSLIRQAIAGPALYGFARDLARTGSPTAQEIGAVLLAAVYLVDPAGVADELERVSDSPHWEVREWGAAAAGQVLATAFESFYPAMVRWSRSSSANVRRAAVVAAKYACRSRDPRWAAPLLDLLEPLLSDPDPYVKKNLGPFALGDGLLRCYPEATLSRLMAWAHQDDPVVRWNVAMAFSAAEGAKHRAEAAAVLALLGMDTDRRVKQAVSTANRNLQRRASQT